ncbi:cell division protein FtsN [Otariodibacter sp.]|uniref:cell division protein FtsN n=1 Tax=Otariodibacter sp. TaxID=3030919 RepID=UPI002615A31B|nr:cell division protein FtsN [Otariodibacter sp.]
MPSRDYAVRKKNKKSGNKLIILLAIIFLAVISGIALWLLQKSSPPKSVHLTQQVQTNTNTKHELPSRPEEVYSYIRDLETREVPVDKNSTLAKLTKEQEEQIIKQRELEQRKLEQLSQQTQPKQAKPESALMENNTQVTRNSIDKKILEEKKQMEAKKQRELAVQKEKEKEKQQQIVTAKPASTLSTQQKSSSVQYGLQCGAFKNKAQAENMQARLAMAGYNARINSSAEWNRVVVGPIGDRATASAALSNARSVAECLIVRM